MARLSNFTQRSSAYPFISAFAGADSIPYSCLRRRSFESSGCDLPQGSSPGRNCGSIGASSRGVSRANNCGRSASIRTDETAFSFLRYSGSVRGSKDHCRFRSPFADQTTALSERFRAEYDDFDFCYAAWLTERKKIEKNKKYDLGNRREALTQLGPAPVPPLHPFLTAPDPTIEGLIKAWVSAPPSLGLFSAEGGQFIGGFGISPDHRLKTAAALSEMWDGRTIKRIRASDGVNILRGRRLSMHMMVQPDVSTAFLSDPLLRDQGLLSRVLVAAPSSLAGTRLYRETDPSDEADISAYAARILSILSAPWPLTDNRNELSPPALSLTNDAAEMWRAFYDRVERMSGIDNKLWVIGDFAAKAAEHAARIAGVLTVVADERATKISADAMSDGIVLMEWYINEALRLQQIARTDPRLIRANRLLQWLQKRGPVVRVREILQFGPAPERSKKALDETLEILKLHGWVRDVSERPHRIEVAMKDI
jgi:hypothetical protein